MQRLALPGRDRALDTHEIDMAVPMSPDQLDRKLDAIRQFQSTSDDDLGAATRNQGVATEYDELGLAEYEAIEAFQKWRRI